jgi:hypothetical protein
LLLFVFIQVSDEDFLMKKFMNSTLLGLRAAASYQKWHKIKCSFNSVVEWGGGGIFCLKMNSKILFDPLETSTFVGARAPQGDPGSGVKVH